MARRSNFYLRSRAANIETFFDHQPQRVYQRSDFAHLLEMHRRELDLPESFSTGQLVELLSRGGALRSIEVTPLNPSHPTRSARVLHRYVWREASPYGVAVSLRSGSYLTHASACFLHGITEQIPHTIYVNKEQSPKPSGGSLTQESIDRAFQNKPRVSTYVFEYGEYKIVMLSGKNTGGLEVQKLEVGKELLPTTKMERTLIDITVRPVYAGGVHEVLHAYGDAKERISVGTLVATYKKLEYTYPYHQAIGFYMMKAGYPAKTLERIHKFGTEFDFYLTHRIEDPDYDSDWRVYFPKGL